ncbi:hypothetical protein C6401_15230 [Arthrobacter woluwensis]|uniref:DUF2190 family protein n=1 Tax=Arthrobacter woluwensis TaxID=156980 RepID=UPI000D12AB27|nr:DUF2190 family protein [Arthrobacter woluwensis]PSS42910.1 hypothetical protein C6401_15230 [Arthrobacter woluwensis]
MALNQRYPHAKHIELTAPAGGVTGGNPYKIGQFVGVALHTKNAGDRFTLWLDGSYDVTVTGALTEGQLVCIKASDNTLTATATGNFPFGVALAAKGAGAGVVEVAPFGKIITTTALA